MFGRYNRAGFTPRRVEALVGTARSFFKVLGSALGPRGTAGLLLGAVATIGLYLYFKSRED